MKPNKLLTLVMSLFLGLSLVLVAPTQVQADPPVNSTCQDQCIALDDLGLNHGQCTSFCTTCINNGNTEANCTCNILEAMGILEDFFRNYGECIRAVRQGPAL